MTNPSQNYSSLPLPDFDDHHRWRPDNLEFLDAFGHMPGDDVLPLTQQPSFHRHLGPVLLPQQQQEQQHHLQQHQHLQQQQQRHLLQQHHQQLPAPPPPPPPPVLDHLHPQGYFSQPYQEQCGSGKLDKFDSLLPKAGEDRNTLYGHVSRTLGRTLTSPSDAPSTSSSTKSIELESSSDAYSGGSSSRGGDKPIKICEVCGDKAKSFHFGGVSCDSCKAFFRRAVHSDNYHSFRCAYNDSCVITISNRKTCQSCRFKKCTAIGMEKKWIMTEEERSQLQKQRLEKKKKVGVTTTAGKSSEGRPQSVGGPARVIAAYEPDVHAMLNYMSLQEQSEIEALVVKFHQSYKDIPYKVQQSTTSRNSIEIIEMFTTILRRMVYFHKTLPDFNELSQEDQSTLLRQGVLEMCMLRSALTYDFKNNRWPVQTGGMEFLRNCPVLRVEDMKKLVSPDLYKMQMEFISGIQELQADEPIVTLLSLIVLYYPDRTGLKSADTVNAKQDKYLGYLENYISWRFGPHAGKMFAKFLAKLADLRQLNDSHNEYNLRLAQQEVNQIQEQLSSINLNPYTQWDLVKYDKDKTVSQPQADSGSVQRVQQTLGQSFGHPMDPSQNGQQGPSIPPSIHRMSQHSQNPQSKQLPPQDQLHDLPQLIHSQQQQPPPDPNQQSDSQNPQKSNNSPFKPSFVGVLFSQMVNRHIPLLMEDPMATISSEQELATVTRFFADSGMSKMTKMSCSYNAGTHAQQAPAQLITATSPIAYDPDSFRSSEPVAPYTATRPSASFDVNYHQQQTTYYQMQNNHPANDNYYSSLKTILDTLGNTSDPTLLHKIKQSLSPTVLSKLRETLGTGNTTDLSGLTEPCTTTPPRTPNSQPPTWPPDRRSEEADKNSPHHQQHNNHSSQQQYNSHSSQQLQQHNTHSTPQQAQAQHAPHTQVSFTHYQQQTPPQQQRQQNEHAIISEQIQNVLQSFGYERRVQDGYDPFDQNGDQYNPDSIRPPCQPLVEERLGHQQSCDNLLESPPLPYPQDIDSLQFNNQNDHEQADAGYQLPDNKEMSQKYPW